MAWNKDHEVLVHIDGYDDYQVPTEAVTTRENLQSLARRYAAWHTQARVFPVDGGAVTAQIQADTFGGRAWFRFYADGRFEWNIPRPT